MSYQLPYFGELDPETLGEYYDVDVDLAGHKLSLDLNFDEESVPVANLDKLRLRMETLPALLTRAIEVVRESFRNGEDAMEYITMHLDQLGSPEPEDAFAQVHPVRIGLYPEDEEHYFTIDFSIGGELTQYLIVVVFDVDEKLKYITIES